jgi:predicted ATP-dependent protease
VPELFKVLVDFEEEMDRRPETLALYARLLATLITKEGLLPFDREAVARVLEQAARLAGDAEKLSVHMRPVVDLLREADHAARGAAHSLVGAADVDAAIAAQRVRSGRVRDRLREQIRRGIVHVATSGELVGQINGLSVFRLGELELGRPTRITARCRLGRGELVDIEREVELGGPLHSKGVMILAGFLGGRFATQIPLALSASLVFEQSYGPVEGDSASLAELCVLLSELAGLPLRQDLAVTGSVDQLGNVQAVGAINEKIEGFFDACAERGLTGGQGVLIPATNADHLMLRPDVVAAAEAGRFRVWTVRHVDEAIELLTGRPAGDRNEEGDYPEGSVNALVEERLAIFAASARAFAEAQEAVTEGVGEG